MARIAAQVSADRKSLATQSAKSTNRMATAARVTARARESMGSAAFSVRRSSLRSSLRVDRAWHDIFGRILVLQARLAEGGPVRIDGHQSAGGATRVAFGTPGGARIPIQASEQWSR